MSEKLKLEFSFVRGNVLVIVVSQCILFFAMFMPTPYVSLYALALGGRPQEIGLINTLAALGGLITFPIGGYIADYKGRAKLVGVITYLCSFSFLVQAFARDWIGLAVGRFIHTFFLFYHPAMYAILADSLPPKRRAVGIATTLAIPNLIVQVSPLIAGYLLETYGVVYAMRLCYILGFAFYLVAATIRFKFLKETLREPRESVSIRNLPLFVKTSYTQSWEALKWMPPSLRCIVALTVLNHLFLAMAGPFWVVYGANVIRLSAIQWGLILLIMGAVRWLLGMPMGMILDRYGKRRPIVAALALSPLPVFLFAYSRTFLSTLILFILLGIINAVIAPAFQTLTADLTPRQKRGRIMAALGGGGGSFLVGAGGAGGAGFVLVIPNVIGSLIGGYIYASNPEYPFFLFSLSLIACFLFSIKYVREPEKPEE